MTPGSFPQSLGKQFTQSLGLQRGHGGGDPLQTWESFIIIHFTEKPLYDNQGSNTRPPAPIDQNILVGELNLLDWDFINHGAIGTIREYVITYDPSRVVHSYNFANSEFNWQTYPLQSSYPINNMFPGLPIYTPRGSTVGPVPYIGQASRQCSFWKTETGFDQANTKWRSWVYLQKSRYKWNRVVPHGFFAVCNVWWIDQFGYKYGSNPDDTTPNDYLQNGHKARISLEDITLISEHTSVAPNTWIYPPYSFQQGQPGTFTTGFAGQIMLSIDFETPAEWSARTGLHIS